MNTMEEEARNETARETDKATTHTERGTESPQLSADGSSGDWNDLKDYMKIKNQNCSTNSIPLVINYLIFINICKWLY